MYLEEGAKSTTEAGKIVNRLSTAANRLQAVITEISRPENNDVHSFLGRQPMPDLDLISVQLAGIVAACHLGNLELRKQTRKARERDGPFLNFVCSLADLFCREYGPPTSGETRKGARDTPFTTLVRELRLCVPHDRASETAVEQRIHRALRFWKSGPKSRKVR
jgi:hypothetical protein